MAIGRGVGSPAWVGLFRDVAKRMTTLTWLASRAFNHFVLSAVVGGQFEITNSNVFDQVLGLCFTIGSVRISKTDFKEMPVVAAWIQDFRALNADFPLIDKQGLGNVIKFAKKQYRTAVENYLTYGLPSGTCTSFEGALGRLPGSESNPAKKTKSAALYPRSSTTRITLPTHQLCPDG